MNKPLLVLLSAFALTVAACTQNPPPTPPTPPAPPPPPPAQGIVSAPGAPVGTPLVQTVSASGTTLSAAGMGVTVPRNALDGAKVTLQPITDTLNSNASAQGIAISSDAAWNGFLKVTFPITAADENPEGLGLAVQQADGSWRALEPVRVDAKAGTVSAGLLAQTEAQGASSVRPLETNVVIKRIVKFKRFYLKPSSATLKVGQSLKFTPYAQVVEEITTACGKAPEYPTTGDPEIDELALITPNCKRQVVTEYPLLNNKSGYSRSWTVSPNVGSIRPESSSGATYTAPSSKPDPDTVNINFLSQDNSDPKGLTFISLDAKVKITDDIERFSGPVSFNYNIGGYRVQGGGTVTYERFENEPDVARYQIAGGIFEATFTLRTDDLDCNPVTLTLPAAKGESNGTIIYWKPGSNPGKVYNISLNSESQNVTLTCRDNDGRTFSYPYGGLQVSLANSFELPYTNESVLSANNHPIYQAVGGGTATWRLTKE